MRDDGGMTHSHSLSHQIAALEKFGAAIASGTSLAQLRAAQLVDAASCCILEEGLTLRQRALMFEAHTLLAMTDMRFSDAIQFSTDAAEAWRGFDAHANELAMRMAMVTAQIGETHPDTLAIVPLAAKLDHLLTALEAAEPTRRQLVESVLTTGFANLAIDRLEVARAIFERAHQLADDDIERGKAIGARALCAQQAGHDSSARELAAEAIAHARSTGDDVQLATMLRFLAGVHGMANETPEALEVAEEAADLADGLGDVLYASTLRLRGMLRMATGAILVGCADLERSIVLQRHGAWTHTLASEVQLLAKTLIGVGEHAKAERVLRENEPFLERTMGEERAEIDVLRYSVALRNGNHRLAGSYAETVGGILAEAHHKDAAAMFEAAADSFTVAQAPEDARRCRERAATLR